MNKITYQERERVEAQAIATYGQTQQILMVLEEMSELQKEICKGFRPGKGNKAHLAEEIADVTIMLEQLRLMFGLNDMVCEAMDAKIERLADRLGMEGWKDADR